MKIIKEETNVDYKSLDELSYVNDGLYVQLYVNKELVGKVIVFLDSEEDNREYICINYEIIYLDTIVLG